MRTICGDFVVVSMSDERTRARRRLGVLALMTTIAAVWALFEIGHVVAASVLDPNSEALGAVLPGLGPVAQNVDHLSIETPRYSLSLAREEGSWRAVSEGGYPIRRGIAEALINQLAALQRREPKTRNPEWYARIAVGAPDTGMDGGGLIRLGTGEDQYSLIVGIRATSVGNDPLGATFVRGPESTQSWLATGTVELPGTLSNWFERLIHIPGPEVRRIEIYEGDTLVLAADRMADGRQFALDPQAATPMTEGRFLDDAAVKDTEAGIVSVMPQSMRAAEEITFPANARRIRFTRADGLAVDVTAAEVDGNIWVAYRAEAAGAGPTEAAAINDRAAGWVFRIADAKAEALLTPIASILTDHAPEVEANVPVPGQIIAPGAFEQIPGFGAPQ